jgi:hypothetical protein
MKKLLIFTFITQILMLILVGCAPGAPVQVLTPAPTSRSVTPVPGGEITVPAVSIQFNAPGPNPLVNTPDSRGQVADALIGLWHGFISPVSLILSFSNNNVQMYEVHNNGSSYNVGFLLGIIVLFAVLGSLFRYRRG